MIDLVTLVVAITAVLAGALHRDLARSVERRKEREFRARLQARRIAGLQEAFAKSQVHIANMGPVTQDFGRAAVRTSDSVDAMTRALHALDQRMRSPYKPSKKQKGQPDG